MCKRFTRQLLPILLSIIMAVEMIPATAFAAEVELEEPGELEELVEPEELELEADGADGLQDFEDPGSDGTVLLDTQIRAKDVNPKDLPAISLAYDAAAADPLNAVLQGEHALSVYVNGKQAADGTIPISGSWQKAKADGEWADLYPVTEENSASWEALPGGAVPKGAGKYIYTASVAAAVNVCSAASLQIPCEITKQKLTIGYYNGGLTSNPSRIYVLPGSGVLAFINEVKSRLRLYVAGRPLDQNEYFAYLSSLDVLVKKGVDENAELVSAGDVFQSTTDYFYSITPVLKESLQADYEIEPKDTADNYLANRSVLVGDAAPSRILINEKGGGQNLVIDPAVLDNSQPVITGKQYDGNPISAATDILPQINVRVQYDADSDPETDPDWISITDDDNAKLENLTMQWWDSGCSYPLDGAPSAAGLYTLAFSYEGKDGIYKPSDRSFIRVKIKAQEIYVKPEPLTESFYTGMKVQDVIGRISYQVLLSADNSKKDIDKATFWGVAVHEKDFNQSYAPLFGLRAAVKDSATGTWKKDARGNIIYTPCRLEEKLDGDKKYIAVFTGEKAIFDETGYPVQTMPVNEKSLNSASSDYRVLVEDEILSENFIDINVGHAVKTQIDVTALLRDGKGTRFEDPIVSINAGEELYKNRVDYKKAVVKNAEDASAGPVAENAAGTISYRWQELTGAVADADGNPELQYQYWTGSTKSPCERGLYRLEITYSDPAHVYAPAEAYVYYEIRSQFVMLEPEGAFTAYEGNTVGEFLDIHAGRIGYMVYKLADNAYDPAVKGDAIEIPAESYTVTWTVEVSADGGKSYEQAGSEDFFNAGNQYRLRPDMKFSDDTYTDRYNDYRHFPVKECCFSVMPAIQVAPMGTKPVTLRINADKFSFDAEKPGQMYKVYDGESYALDNIDALVSVLDPADDTEIAGFPKDQIVAAWSVTHEGASEAVKVSAPRDAGTYTLSVYFPGNGVYKSTRTTPEVLPNIRIGRRELTITPAAKRVVKAGNNFAPAEDFPLSMYRIEGAAESDSAAFTYRKYSHDGEDVEAVEAFVISYTDGPKYSGAFETAGIFDKNGTQKRPAQRYRSDMEYYACTSLPEIPGAAVMAEPYLHNYRLVNAKTFHRAERVGAAIYGVGVHLRTERKNDVTRIVPNEGLRYFGMGEFTDLDGNKLPEGNYFAFRIQAPLEFNNPENKTDAKGNDIGYNNIFESRVLFKNAITNAGGYVTGLDGQAGEIVVAFPVKADSENASFEIHWHDGFLEKFEVVIAKALLCSDTSKAVLPKSMKFKGVSSKMAVGQMQQINLTVVKKQISDVVRVGYSVSDSSILNVTRNGALTALKTGKATVMAYPVRIVDDEEIPIKGGKTIKMKITVGKVAKPSITKVAAWDNTITVRYKEPANGFRREFYVLEGKVKADAFEEKIKEYENGTRRDTFVITPEYGDGIEDESGKPGTFVKVLGVGRTGKTLEHDKEYTVYVRNVSGVRTMYDGSTVEPSAAGSVKTVKTTKGNVQALQIALDQKYASASGTSYDVPFAEKSVMAAICGEFYEYLENPAAESDDYVAKAVPLSKEDKEKYINPKISCYVTDPAKDALPEDADAKLAKACGYTVKIGSRYYYPSKIASVNKKGKLTLKGLGKVRVWVYNNTSGKELTSYMDVNITGSITSFSGKTGKIKVGQKLDLNTLLTYKSGKRKVVGNPVHFAAPSVVLPESEELPWYIDEAGLFVAKKAGKYTITMSDAVVAESGGKGETTVKVKVSAMEPVKELKKVFVYDAYAKIRFTYNNACFSESTGDGENSTGVDFRVDVRDSAGRLVYSQFLDGDIYESVKGNVREYYYVIDKLSRRSSYKVQVTAFRGDEQSKAASVSIKTTGVPASYMDMDSIYQYEVDLTRTMNSGRAVTEEAWYHGEKVSGARNGFFNVSGSFYDQPEWLPDSQVQKNVYQGVHIDTWGIKGDAEVNRELDSHPFFTSGSSYVLSARERDLTGLIASDLYPKEAKSDTLVWKVKNKKIASVSTLKGTFSAKLKAINPGTTILEVSSKNTKKVIARYDILVKPVGDGHDYFGDYDDYYNGVQWDPAYEKSVETIYVGNPLDIKQEEKAYVWVRYEAKESGIHTFDMGPGQAPDSIRISDQTRSGRDEGWIFDDLLAGVYLYEGMQLYMRVQGTVESLRVFCTPTAGIGADDTLRVEDDIPETFTYTAKAGGCFTFSSDVAFLDVDTDAAYPIVRENYRASATPLTEGTDYRITDNAGRYEVSVLIKTGVTIRMQVKKKKEIGRPYTIKVTKREYTELTDQDKEVKIGAGGDAWLRFEAPEDGEYIFIMSKATEALGGGYYDALDRWDASAPLIVTAGSKNAQPYRVHMRQGDEIAFRLVPEDQTLGASANVRMGKPTAVTDGTEGACENDKEHWHVFTSPANGFYEFDIEVVSGSGTVTVEQYAHMEGSDAVSAYGDAVTGTVNKLHRMLRKDERAIFKITANSDVPGEKLGVSWKVNNCAFTQVVSGDTFAMDAGEYGHYKLTAAKSALYDVQVKQTSPDGTVRLIGAYLEDIAGNLSELEGFVLGETMSGVLLRKGESLYFVMKESSESAGASGIILAGESAGGGGGSGVIGAEPVLPGTPLTTVLEDEKEKWYVFTARDFGYYEFLVEKDPADTRIITVAEHQSVGGGKIGDLPVGEILHRRMNAGDQIIFKLKAEGTGNSTLTIRIGSCDFSKELPSAGGSVTIGADGYGHCKWKAQSSGNYNLLVKRSDAASGFNLEWAYREDLNTKAGGGLTIDTVKQNVPMRNGEYLYFLLKGTNGDAGTITADLITDMSAGENSGEDMTLGKGEYRWLAYHVKQAGRYYIGLTGTNADKCTVEWGTSYGESSLIYSNDDDAIAEVGNIFAKDTTIYIKVSGTESLGSAKANVRLQVEKVSPVPIAAGASYTGISMKPADHVWHNFKADNAGLYLFEYSTSSAVGADCMYYEPIKEGASGSVSGGGKIAELQQKNGQNRVVYMMDRDRSVDLHFYDKAAPDDQADIRVSRITTPSIPVNVDPSTLAPVSFTPAGKTVWYQFTALAGGTYTLEITEATARINAVFYGKTSASPWTVYDPYDTASLTQTFTNGQEILIALSAENGVAASAKVRMVSGELKDLTYENGAAEDTRTDVEDGQELWYTFTAPDYGFYEFTIKDTSGNRSLTVTEHASVGGNAQSAPGGADPLTGGGTIVHRLLTKGQKVVFKVKAGTAATGSDTSTVQVRISKCDFVPLAAGGGAVDVNADGYGHYLIQAPVSGRYDLLMQEDAANTLDIIGSYREDHTISAGVEKGITKSITLRKDECVYFLLQGTGTGTITAELISETGGSNVEEEITLDADGYQWLTYDVKQAGRYYIGLTGEDAGSKFKVEWGTSYDSIVPLNDDMVKLGNIFAKDTTIYIKVSRKSGTGRAGAVLHVEKVNSVPILEGTSYTGISMKPSDHVWHNFTAATGGYYLFEYDTVPADGAECKYYEPVKAGAAGTVSGGGEIEGLQQSAGSKKLVRMDENASYDLHFYEKAAPDKKAFIKVTKVSSEGPGEEIPGQLKDLVSNNDGVAEDTQEGVADNQILWYTFTAPDYGFYEFTIKDTRGNRSLTVTEHASVGDKNQIAPVGGEPLEEGTVAHKLLTKGQKVVFKVKAGTAVAGSDTSTVKVRISKCDFVPPDAGGVVGVNADGYGHYLIQAPVSGRYDLLMKADAGSTLDIKGSYREDHTISAGVEKGIIKSITLRKDECVYFLLQGTGTGTITAELISETGGSNVEEEITLDAGGYQWLTYDVKQAGRYYIGLTGEDAGEFEVKWGTSYGESGLIYSNDDDTIAELGNIFAKDTTIYIKVSRTNGTGRAGAVLHVEKVNPVPILEGTSYTGISMKPSDHVWHNFTADTTGGCYLFEYDTVPAAGAECKYYEPVKEDASGTVSGGGKIDGLQQSAGGKKIVCMAANASYDLHFYDKAAPDKKASIKVTKVNDSTSGDASGELKELEAGTPFETDDPKMWYSFTADEYTFYEFTIANQSGSGALAVSEYENVGDTVTIMPPTGVEALVGDGTIVHRLLTKGQKVVFRVQTNGAGVRINISKCDFNKDDNADVLLNKGCFGHYKLKAPEDGLYNVLVSSTSTNGSFKIDAVYAVCRDEQVSRYVSWTKLDEGSFQVNKIRGNVALAKNEFLYIILEQTGDETATGSITMHKLKSLGGGGSTQENVSLAENAERWYTYRVDRNGRYYISLSDVAPGDCSITLYKGENNILVERTPKEPDDEVGNVFHAGELVYIKVKNKTLAGRNPVLHIERVLPGILRADSVNKRLEAKKGDHNWYQFTAAENGYYLFEYTKNSGGTGATCKYYEEITDSSNGKWIGDMDDGSIADGNGSAKVIVMSRGKTFDFHFYDGNDSVASSAVLKITFVGANIASSVDELDETYTISKPWRSAWYQFDAQAGTTYRCVSDAENTMNVQYFAMTSDSGKTPVTYTLKPVTVIPASGNEDADEYLKLDSEHFTNVTDGPDILIRFERADANAEDVHFAITNQKIVTLKPSKKVTITSGATSYVRLADPDNTSDLYYVESSEKTGHNYNGVTYDCEMKQLSGTRFAGGERREIFDQVRPDSDFGKIYKVTTNSACELSLTETYNMTLNKEREVEVVGKGNYIYITFTASEDGIYSFVREKVKNEVKDDRILTLANVSLKERTEEGGIKKYRKNVESIGVENHACDANSKGKVLYKNSDPVTLRVTNPINKGNETEKEKIKVVKQEYQMLSATVKSQANDAYYGEWKNIPKRMTRWFAYQLDSDKDKRYTFKCYSTKITTDKLKEGDLNDNDNSLKFSMYYYNGDASTDINELILDDAHLIPAFDNEQLRGTNGQKAEENRSMNDIICFKAENPTGSDVRAYFRVDSANLLELQKEEAGLGVNKYTKENLVQFMEFSFTPDDDGYYEFDVITSDGKPKTITCYPYPGDNRVIPDANGNPNTVGTKYEDICIAGIVSPFRLCFIPKGHRVTIKNYSELPFRKEKEEITLIIKKNYEKQMKVLEPGGGKSPDRLYGWQNRWFDIYRYDPIIGHKVEGDKVTYIYGTGKYQIDIYDWDKTNNKPANTKHNIRGISVRDQDGYEIASAGNCNTSYPQNIVPGTDPLYGIEVEITKPTVLYITVFLNGYGEPDSSGEGESGSSSGEGESSGGGGESGSSGSTNEKDFSYEYSYNSYYVKVSKSS